MLRVPRWSHDSYDLLRVHTYVYIYICVIYIYMYIFIYVYKECDRRSSTVASAEAHDGFSSTVDDQQRIDIFLTLAPTLECACV